MTRSALPGFDTAIAQLCSSEWAPSGTHVATCNSTDVLKALLPASRTDEGREALGSSPGAIENLVCVLRDPLVFHEQLGELAIRLLRNMCARSPANQTRAAECRAHELILDCIAQRFRFSDEHGGAEAFAVRRMEVADDVDHHRMKLPFFGFAVEFMVNFVTGNAGNAESIWQRAFPRILQKLLTSQNHAAASAAAALVHNCIAVVPERMKDVVTKWSGADGDRNSLTVSLLQQLKMEKGDDKEDEKFSWTFMIIRRLIGASLLKECFEVLGPSVGDILASSQSFSENQQVLLHLLEASASRSAEVSPGKDVGIEIPQSSLPFFGELLEAALFMKDGNMLQILGSTIASAVILSEDSAQLEELRLQTVKTAVNVLHALASHATPGANGVPESDINLADMDAPVGLRAMMIRAIAICCDSYKKAQDSVRNLQGLPVVLNALSYEKDVSLNPFLREWAILAVRNLTFGNPENAQEITGYELMGIQNDTEFLEKTGLEAFMDPESGRPKLRMGGSSREPGLG